MIRVGSFAGILCCDDFCFRYAQRADCVQNCDYRYAHIGKDCRSHGGDSQRAEDQDQSFDAEGKYDILMDDA